jgi:hypothetical protein
LRFGKQTQFDKVLPETIGLATPDGLDVSRHVWKERHGDTLLSVFSLDSNHMGWHGIIHGGIVSGVFDDIFARYCYSESAGAIPLTKLLQVEYIKTVCPEETCLFGSQKPHDLGTILGRGVGSSGFKAASRRFEMTK